MDQVPAEGTLWNQHVPFLELTHNWGTETDESFAGYHTGNTDPRGYGHIGIMKLLAATHRSGIVVPDVYKACERLEKLGVNVRRKPGPMQGLLTISTMQ